MKKAFVFFLHLLACVLLCTTGARAQSKMIHGTVVDTGGEPVIGAAVSVVGNTNIGTATDLNGEFSLNVPDGATMNVESIGYKPVTFKVGSQSTYNLVLEEDTEMIEETVVIGYGTVKKSDLTGSVVSVSEEDMTKAATSDPLMAIQGRAAGVQIISATGSPSATAEIKIRGTGSPNGTTPLFVVDGFPMNDIDYLSPNDISSIEILKDASATAIYGSRGANGVVIVTTKRAQAGALKIRISAEYGIENLPTKPEMLNSQQYAEMTNKANANSGLAPAYANPGAMAYDTNWYDEVMRMGRYQNYSLSVVGGSETMNTIFTTNYFRRDGTVKSTAFDRLNFTQNTTIKLTRWWKASASFQGSFGRTNSLGANGTNNNTIFLSSLIAPPDVPVWDELTDYYSGITAIRLANPAGVIARNNSLTKRNSLIANFSTDVNLFPWLVYTSRFGYRYNISLGSGYDPAYYETSSISSPLDTVTRSTSVNSDWSWENMLTFNKTWGIHNLTAMVAMSAREFRTETYSATKQNTPSAADQYHYFNAASDNPQASGSASELTMLSYLGRINYNLLDRYLLTVSMRADGSSRFLKQNRWGYFPSGAFAWKISEEPFFRNWGQSVINTAKLRLGWGQIGNERISSYYPYLTPMSMGQYYTIGSGKNRVNGARQSNIGNPEVMWETSEQSNIGFDFSFLRNRLSLTADWFLRKTDNILLNQSIPRTSGYSSMTRNVGGMSNKGIELSLGWKDDIGNFSYSIDGNVSFIKNEVTNLGTSENLTGSFAYDYALIDFQGQFSNPLRSEVGQPYNMFWGYVFNGIFQTQEQIDNYKNSRGEVIMPNAKPGDSIFVDLNDDGKISTDDMTFIGNPHPKAIFGLSLNAAYKGFDLSLLFQGTVGNDVFNASKFYFENFTGTQNVLARTYMKAWDGEGSTNEWPIMLANSSDKARNTFNWSQSSFYIEDGSYVRLKNFQLGYNFKPNLIGRKSNMRIYFSAQNLLTFTKYSGIDPEIPDNGIDRGQYPQPLTLMLGVNINL